MIPRVWSLVVVVMLYFILADVASGQEAETQVNGNNVCSVTVSFNKVQKVPITGIQTKVVRYVTRCGFGLLQCSRYRTIYVPAYREITRTGYRTTNVCCTGYVAVNWQCVTSNSSGPAAKPTKATPPVKKNRSGSTQHNPKGTGREKGSREGSKRLPTQKVVPRKTPVVHDGISHYDGTGRGVADGSHHGGGRTVLVEDKKILTIDGRDYDTSPENYHPSNGSGMVGMALGVGVVMSLTGVLVGVVIMKFRMRKITARDVMLLSRDKYSRRTTRNKSQTISEALSKRTQKQRVVSYVDVMDVREKMVADQPQPSTTKKIPQCSLPRIPEAVIESSEVNQPNGKQDSLLELKEVQLVTTNNPPYAIVKKSSKLTNTSENVRPSSLLSMGRVSRSNSSAYAIVDDLNGTVVGSSSPISTRNSSVVPLRDQQPPTEFASLYAKVNKNKNSNNEHKHRFSHGTIHMSFVEDDSIYGKLDHPPQSQPGVTPAYYDSLKYDRLKRGPLSRSIRKSKRFSELYESI